MPPEARERHGRPTHAAKRDRPPKAAVAAAAFRAAGSWPLAWPGAFVVVLGAGHVKSPPRERRCRAVRERGVAVNDAPVDWRRAVGVGRKRPTGVHGVGGGSTAAGRAAAYLGKVVGSGPASGLPAIRLAAPNFRRSPPARLARTARASGGGWVWYSGKRLAGRAGEDG